MGMLAKIDTAMVSAISPSAVSLGASSFPAPPLEP
jgi:hypothetical protein